MSETVSRDTALNILMTRGQTEAGAQDTLLTAEKQPCAFTGNGAIQITATHTHGTWRYTFNRPVGAPFTLCGCCLCVCYREADMTGRCARCHGEH